ncbi:glutamine--fructose-6-phosphate aminotransferase [isomerizing] [Siccirubricoccus deserti]|uniref:Glutamine--fructose-6-phosphate aminotransferase [isomerizing] n=1 Tax=Siccirubricoccus deserti TaxID=2013562 RepID=A0A9X0R243_9PROT|nr:glutamine--fructose-6-phosphate transaminase (isomerizing) [Siccirubricoccus deserti]MBC4017013.1 glutamine--fructose-6-phosphate transaminase (isomerizing) [Siccirubricoccus deserti]GGC56038.1 glutamine--fructose-6-phosphate aminotransferase [isomerizing] [Siccirubricoccus deserti]
MCGIVGVVGKAEAAPLLLEALRRLEYRGYDSAGIATLVDGRIDRRRAEGKLGNLAGVLDREPLTGTTGIGHTRWATHGAPTERNAHPHSTHRVSVVHNGIIENHAELRAELEAKGAVFETETDTETFVRLVDDFLAHGLAPAEAFAAALKRVHGAFALAAIFAGHPKLLLAARQGAPLAVGYGEGEMFIGSDALALAPLTRRIAYLEEGDWVALDGGGARFFDAAHAPVERPVVTTAVSGAAVGKGNHRHFMEKELHEHPAVLGDTLRQYLDPGTQAVRLPRLPFDPAVVPRLTISACGSAFLAGLVGRYWIEQLARLPVDADVASEFRYRNPPLAEGGAAILVSQSGETADTMAALRLLREAKQSVLAVVNVPESSMARESDAAVLTVAGPEIGVASTKAFTAQLAVMACLSIGFGRARGHVSAADEAKLTEALLEVPSQAAEILACDAQIQALAVEVAKARDVLFLGRGSLYPIALEGALKLKEISYIHAEGYAAGEMKHGPIALIDSNVPVIALCPTGPLFEKTASNLQEAAARGGRIMAFTDADGVGPLSRFAEQVIELPKVGAFSTPILYAIPVQLLAYHVAVLKGTDVDQPRNLAKSVTVE